jgi:hypothetical protein
VQALDWLRFDTSLASLSPRTVLIATLVLARLNAYGDMLRRRSDLWYVSAALAVWWLLSPLRASHSVVGESPLRGLVTDGAFIAVLLIGATFGSDAVALRSVARGAAAALLFLGLASLLVSVGWLDEPDRSAPGREIFGVQSPFLRNYGLDVPWDAVALLVPLCVPYYLLALLDLRSSTRARYEAGVVLVLLISAFGLFFQARGMVAQVLIAAVLMTILARRRALAVTSVLLAAVGIGLIGRLILDIDEISTNIRVRANGEALSTAFESISHVLVGADEEIVMNAVLSEPELGDATAGLSIAIHNVFLGDLVTGGILSFLALAVVVVYVGVRLILSDLTDPSAKVLLVAFVLVLVEMNIEPLRANVIGSWLILGLALGLEAPRESRASSRPCKPRATRPRGRARLPA